MQQRAPAKAIRDMAVTEQVEAVLAPFLQLFQQARTSQESMVNHQHQHAAAPGSESSQVMQHHDASDDAMPAGQLPDGMQLLQPGAEIDEVGTGSKHPDTAREDDAAAWLWTDQRLVQGEVGAVASEHVRDGAVPGTLVSGIRHHPGAAMDAEAREWLQAASVAGVAARRLQQDTASVTNTLLQVIGALLSLATTLHR